MKKHIIASAVAAALALVVTGCGQDDAAQESTGTITVGALPVADYAPVYYAAEKGIFADHGLEVDVVPIQGGANAVPALLSGDFDIAVTNWPSYLLALGSDLPVNAVVPAAEGSPDYAAIVAAPGSGIASPADLAGKTIAVNNLRSVAELTARVGLDEAGVDPATVKFTELPLPDTAGALAKGSVDAAWVVEPFLSASLDAGATKVIDPFAGSLNGMPLGSLSTSKTFAEANPDALDDFSAAMDEASEALADETTFRAFLPSYTGLSADVAAKIVLPTMAASVDSDDLDAMAQRMTEYGWLDSEVDVPDSLTYLHDGR